MNFNQSKNLIFALVSVSTFMPVSINVQAISNDFENHVSHFAIDKEKPHATSVSDTNTDYLKTNPEPLGTHAVQPVSPKEESRDNKPKKGSAEPEFIEPAGSMHPNGQAYVKRIYTTGAMSDIDNSWDTSPEQVYTLVEQQLIVTTGSVFTLHMLANDLGNTDVARCDLRNDVAHIFTDWEGLGHFDNEATYGDCFTTSNIPANYNIIMSLSHDVTVPKCPTPSFGCIRIIYNNAWKTLSGPNTQDIVDGQALDIPVMIIAELAGTSDIVDNRDGRPEGTYDMLGRKIIGDPEPGLYIIDGKKVLIK